MVVAYNLTISGGMKVSYQVSIAGTIHMSEGKWKEFLKVGANSAMVRALQEYEGDLGWFEAVKGVSIDLTGSISDFDDFITAIAPFKDSEEVDSVRWVGESCDEMIVYLLRPMNVVSMDLADLTDSAMAPLREDRRVAAIRGFVEATKDEPPKGVSNISKASWTAVCEKLIAFIDKLESEKTKEGEESDR